VADNKTVEHCNREAERLIKQSESVTDSAVRLEMLRSAAGFRQLAALLKDIEDT
jgi:hypothetical protein